MAIKKKKKKHIKESKKPEVHERIQTRSASVLVHRTGSIQSLQSFLGAHISLISRYVRNKTFYKYVKGGSQLKLFLSGVRSCLGRDNNASHLASTERGTEPHFLICIQP